MYQFVLLSRHNDPLHADGGCAPAADFDIVTELRVREMAVHIDRGKPLVPQASNHYPVLVASHGGPAQRDVMNGPGALIHVECPAARTHGCRDKRNVNGA